MDHEQVRAIANRFIDQLHRVEQGNPAEINDMVALFCDDAQLSNPIIEHDSPARAGREEIARFWHEYKRSFRDIRSEFTDVTTSAHSAGLFWESNGLDATGQPLAYKGVTQLILDDSGKIRRFVGYFDSAALRESAR